MKSIYSFIPGLLFTVGFTSDVHAEEPPPMRASHQIETMLAGKGDRSIETFISKHISPSLIAEAGGKDDLVKQLRALRSEFKGAHVQYANLTAPNSIELQFKPGPYGREKLNFTIEADPPHRFTAIEFSKTISKTLQSLHENMTDREMVRAIDQRLEELVEKGNFSGAVLLAKGDKPLFRKAYGLASQRFNVPNQPDTKFNLGSINKMFTGLAICQLIQQGKISLDDTVGKHLPDYPNADVAENVTIRHLLTHSSGLGSYWNEEYDKKWTTIRTVDDFMSTFVNEPLMFEPGEKFGYSNAGPIVLGSIIEKLTGESYYDYVRKYIYEPAGMKNTDCYAIDMPIPNLAIGYTKFIPGTMKQGDVLRENTLAHSIKGGPAGGGYSTVDDLFKFAQAIQQHKLLNPAMTDMYLEGKISLGPDAYYACLIDDVRRKGHRKHGHNGGAPGISADFGFYPDLGYTFVVLSNSDGDAMNVSSFITNLITNRESSISENLKDPDVPPLANNDLPPYIMGVMLQMSEDGIKIDRTMDGFPAEKAGLRAGDIIVAANGEKLGDTPLEVLNKFLQHPDPIKMTIDRDGKTLDIMVTPEPTNP